MDRTTPDEYEISCDALGIVGCHRTFRGETAGDVVDQVSDHLRSEHDIDLPDRDVILRSDEGIDVDAMADRILSMGYSKKAVLVMRRLRELLDVRAPEEGEPTV